MGFVVRTVGILLFAAAFIALVADGVRSLAVDTLVWTPLGQLWAALSADSLAAAESLVKTRLDPYLWDNGIEPVLGWPGFAVVGVVGLVLLILGRRRRSPGPAP